MACLRTILAEAGQWLPTVELRERWGRWSCGAAGALLMLAGMGCDSLLKNDKLPPNVTDPAITETPQGALTAYYGTVAQFRNRYAGGTASNVSSRFVTITGLLTDELVSGSNEDLRAMPELPNVTYSIVYADQQHVRGLAGQALGLLADYRPEQPELAAHVYALEGYAEVFLAELFCSGIPLSTLDYKGDYTLQPGSTTEEVFTHAAALFDSALARAGDSVNFQRLAQIGKARALLALGQYAEAATAVSGLPDDYVYAFRFDSVAGVSNFAATSSSATGRSWGGLSVPDIEGINGLPWASSGDPRTIITNVGEPGKPVSYPSKYAVDGSSPVVLASGVEARLIEAEAALQAAGLGAGGTWLATLNALRTDGTFDVDTQVVSVDNTVTPPDTTFAYDTLWHAGTGGVAGLEPLADPGTADSRVGLLFHERAFWLFLTGHRQGDLRRLIRQYGRTQDQVYPTGVTSSGLFYGGDVTEPVPYTEAQSNALYHGCFSRDA